LIGRLVQLLRGQGLRKGVIGGNRRWMTIWAVVTAGHFMHKLLKSKPVIERFELKPGETVVVTDLGAPDPAS
jgi:hypothetical protein